MVALCFPAFAQNQNGAARLAKILNKAQNRNSFENPKDDPSGRLAYEVLRLKDPSTGKIPSTIHQMELKYFEEELRNQSSNSRVAANLIQWTNRGPFNVGGRTRALAIDISDENVILAGGVSGGVWRSENGGDSWSKTTNSNELQSVTAIAQDTRSGHTNVWYYTTGEFSGNSASGSGAFYRGDGIFRSIDGGLNWELLPSTSTNTAEESNVFDINHEIAVSPLNGTVFLANWTGIYKSENGGNSWNLSFDINDSDWTDVAVDSQGNVYAFHNENGVIKSVDNGTSWTNISSSSFPTFGGNARGELAIAASNEDVVYLLAEANTTSGYSLWRYDANTNSWTDRSLGIPQLGGRTGDFDSQGGYDLLIKVKPNDEDFVVIGGTNIFRSTDGFSSDEATDWIGGYTPENTSFGLYTNHHPDQHCMVFYPSDPNKAISGNDGGLQVTNDIRSTINNTEPVSWVPINNGYLTTQSYAVSIGPGNLIMSGFQDNGTWRVNSEDPSESWTDPFGGDGSYNAFNSNGTNTYVSAQNAFLYRIVYDANDIDRIVQFVEFFDGDGKNPLFISPFYIDTKDDNIFYLGGMTTLHVNTSAETGSINLGWKEINLPNGTGRISELGVIGNGSVYVGTTAGEFYKIEGAQNSSPSITELDNSLFANSYISGIGVNENNADEILLTVSNYSVKSIFFSDDGGVSWAHVSGNLEVNDDGSGSGPSVRSARILGDGEVYIVGTSVGLYTTRILNGENTIWEQEDLSNLGAVVVEHLAIRNEDGLVVAGTHGNGIFSAKIATNENDLALLSIDSPTDGRLSLENVEVSVSNLGQNTVSSFELKYSIDGELQQTEQVNTSLVSGEDYTHTFSQAFDFSAVKTYIIKVELISDGDEKESNNVIELTVENFPVIDDYPFVESFESGPSGWTSEGVWEHGSPSQSLLNVASDGTMAWMTDLDADYSVSLNDKLLSPIFDFTDLANPLVKFDIMYAIEEDWDGVLFAYRTDLSSSQFIIIEEDSGLENWYNKTADVFGRTAWTGSISGFVEATADLTFLQNEPVVQFAFVFASDEFVNDQGFVMDNFRVESGFVNSGAIELSSLTILENNDINDIIGDFSVPNVSQDFTYSLVSGIGDEGNNLFILSVNQLTANLQFNYEDEETYSIRVSAASSQTTIEANFIITILDADDSPTDLRISNSSIDEKSDLSVDIGFFTVDDEDANEEYVFTLIDGTGSVDNGSFTISSNELKTAEIFDFETKNNYTIRVEAKSEAVSANTIEETYSINILDVNDDPTDLVLSGNTIVDKEPVGFSVGQFSALDQDNDELTYDLSDGIGDDDNLSFTITGTQLITRDVADLSTKEIYRILVEASDGKGGFIVSPFEVTVEEILGLINLAKMGISIFPNPVADNLNIKIANEMYGNSSIQITTMEGKRILRKEFNKVDFVQKDKLDLSSLSKGIYLITFEINGKQTTGRLVKK